MNGDYNVYDEDYFLHGKQSGKSLYENYRWMPELTIPMCIAIINHCGIERGDHILDFGCARGYMVKALRELVYNARGVDISQWAIDNADEETKPHLNLMKPLDPIPQCDWIIAKDVLEHVEYAPIVVSHMMMSAAKGVFAVVPLSPFDKYPYVVPEYEKDVTHIHRFTLPTWAAMFMWPGWSVEARYRVCGVKDNYAKYETANGFIVARRIGK